MFPNQLTFYFNYRISGDTSGEIDKIRELKLLDKVFSNDPPGYKKGDRHMITIDEEL